MATLYFRGAGHLGPGEEAGPATINFIPNGYVDGVSYGYATITDADAYRAEKLAMIAAHPELGIVAVESIPPKAPTVALTPAAVFHVPSVADGWNQ
jgi:hypothetical protein